MIVMNLQIDNFFAFKNFHMNMSYPKKIVDSNIENEFLEDYPNFRYKKVNVLMGANATGKTSVGKMLMSIFNFMDKKQFEKLTSVICNKTKKASLSMDFVVHGSVLYRIDVEIAPESEQGYKSTDIGVNIRSTEIMKKDSYESCVKRIEQIPVKQNENYMEVLEAVDGLSWLFEYPSDSQITYKIHTSKNSENYLRILENTLRALDPSIKSVEKIDMVENTYVIRMENRDVVMQDGRIIDTNILSSGTKAGIEVAGVLASMLSDNYGFYYCDEKFSYIHSDIEKAFLSVMVQSLKSNNQLFFTTHNTDILELPYPKHSFIFLQKDSNDEEQPIKCVSASQYLKRNTDSLRNAVDNDLFSVAPNVELIYEIAEM